MSVDVACCVMLSECNCEPCLLNVLVGRGESASLTQLGFHSRRLLAWVTPLTTCEFHAAMLLLHESVSETHGNINVCNLDLLLLCCYCVENSSAVTEKRHEYDVSVSHNALQVNHQSCY